MKRYWKLISIVLITVLVIGTFYIQTGIAKSELPEFDIKTISGNEAELDRIALLGHYGSGGLIDYLEITESGTEYASGDSFLRQLSGNYTSSEVKRLQKNYRNFMRGKNNGMGTFFENESIVAYAKLGMDSMSVSNYQPHSIDISILNKETKKETSFDISIVDDNYQSMYIYAVYVDEEMKILTNNSYYDSQAGKERTEVHVYSIDISAEKLVNDDVILNTEDASPKTIAGIHIPGNLDETDTTNYLLKREIHKEVSDERESYYELTDAELFLYDIGTNELEPINLSNDYLMNAYPIFINDAFIYFLQEDEGELKIVIYNVATKEVERNQTFNFSNNDPLYDSFYKIKDEKLYIINTYYKFAASGSIFIADINTGETLFEGTIEMDNSDQQRMSDLYIYDIEFR
ncbi:hypothetical protein [Oceanobacillus saliphilus]|uniref:hypothetical protein n=1 Tax=Oceanobacillus saliphilus TaxID=2925834 RepID=UPI00201D45CA|nr:hypothetical protein [Oceanobacillus saliphilus]